MFEVGDEIAVHDASPWGDGVPFCLKKGAVFTVIQVWRVGSLVGPDSPADVDAVSIGIDRAWKLPPGVVYTDDLWPAERFRKVERRRDRKALYQKLGISRMVDPCPEVV
ncbi:MAG: hypothetical protein C0421_05775 [Hyphomonas sp.]|uniref:hypothetical protein n=1 Tax=Hyphomonas sp. TaxID=87 RepID=UPI0025C5D79A|nr:hypothetical protein [Hyphomonas sp.]MBA4338335.1 hypothetical protein [Hyphomonas sp.]